MGDFAADKTKWKLIVQKARVQLKTRGFKSDEALDEALATLQVSVDFTK
jgi:hypothetical protein